MNSLLLILCGLAFIVEAGVFFAGRPGRAIPVVLAVAVLDVSQVTYSIAIGGVNVYYPDVMMAAVLLALLIRWTRGHRPDAIVVGLLALLAFNLFRGVFSYGLQASINQGRGYLYLLGAAAFFSTSTDPLSSLLGALRRWWVRSEWVLIGLALLFLARHGFSSYSGEETAVRPLVGGQALVVLEAVILSTALTRHRRLRSMIPVLVGLAVILMSGQRTVWAATAVGLVVLATPKTSGESTRARRRARWLASTAVGGVAAILLVGPGAVTSSIDRAYQSSTGEDSTFTWRLEGWTDLLGRQFETPVANVVLGDPLGAGYLHRAASEETVAPPHSVYVSTFLDLGAVGLVLLVALFVGLARRTRAEARAGSPTALVMHALTAAVVVYGVAYNPSTAEGILLGVALAAFGSKGRRARDEVPPPHRGGKVGSPDEDVGHAAARLG